MIRQVLLGNIILCVQYAVGGLLPIVLIPHIVRSIGLPGYGELAMTLTWATYAAVLVQYAFQYTGPKRLSQLASNESARGVFMEITQAKMLLLGPALLLMAVVAMSLSHGPHSGAQWLLLMLLPLGAALHSGWHLQTAGHFFWVCLVSIGGACIALSIGFFLVGDASSTSVFAASLALGIGPLFAGAGTIAASLMLLKGKAAPVRAAKPIQALREGWPLFISQFTSALYSVSGPLVIRYTSGAEAAGAYSTIERIANAFLGACLLTHTAAYPRLCALYHSNRAGYWRLMRFVILTYLGATCLIVVAALLLRPTLMTYLFGSTLPNGADALLGWSLAWLVIGVLGTALTGYLTVSGQQSQVWPLNLKVLALAIIVGLPASLFWGAWGWMAALVMSQIPIGLTAVRVWSAEFRTERM